MNALLGSTLLASTAVAAAAEGEPTRQSYDVPSQDLGAALRAVGRAANREIIFETDVVQGKRAPALDGSYTTREAVEQLLRGTDLVAVERGGAILIRSRFREASAELSSSGGSSDIVVTGSRIRGAESPSAVYEYSAAEVKQQGVTDLRELASIIPQNFTGGQNPGVGQGPGLFGSQNGDSSTALNLRGLGPDATLTLLNGRRMVYGSITQGVDFSSIPLAAVERVEVLPDGASALYGSDAVGGVVNILLKRNYRGLAFDTAIGASTDGGNFTQNYSAVGGTQWSGGGLVLTGNFARNSAITAGRRSYTAAMNPNATLFPMIRTVSVVASGHQQIGDVLSLNADGYYTSRDTATDAPNQTTGPLTDFGVILRSKSWTYGIMPAATIDLSPWKISLNGVFGRSFSPIVTRVFLQGSQLLRNEVIYDNENRVVEAGAEGPLFDLPGGRVRLAFGGGWRRNELTTTRATVVRRGDQSAYYGYAELNLPLVGEQNAMPGVEKLRVSAAYRYERYDGLSNVGTPRLGLIWAPVRGAEIKLSWGRSFKAPTLAQQLSIPAATLLSAASGGSTVPSGRTLLSLSGGSTTLRPERATSFSATIDIRPPTLPGLAVSVSYFDVRYRDRIVAPVGSIETALLSQAFAELVEFRPSLSAIQEAVSVSPTGLNNQTGRPFDPASVFAIIDGRFRNIASTSYSGVDGSISYRLEFGSRNSLSFRADASYLTSSRQLVPLEPSVQLAGTIFNPPRFRARGGLSWTNSGGVGANLFANYLGSVRDNRTASTYSTASMTTWDITARYKLNGESSRSNWEVQMSVLNLFDRKPSFIRTTSALFEPYDSTNYSAIGRFVKFSLSAQF
ncbi:MULTISPECIES: TonB-dependent receptor [Sphingomonadaceae]|uniref:TonB-dependent receptor n=1 Tax=Sphingomonadales TaxID=204457 RepID=UPI000A56402E|nr:TonB-dependent receptor [Sphingobium sp. TKS]MCF8707564.1 TonB-dependent receptor [Rhizorhapis sp. SPR117]